VSATAIIGGAERGLTMFRRVQPEPKPERAIYDDGENGPATVTVLRKGRRKTEVRTQFGYVKEVPTRELQPVADES
jgi:hypothetical protein